MKMRAIVNLIGLILVVNGGIVLSAVYPQERPAHSSLSLETYERVLDIVFPRDVGNFKNFKKEYALTFRVKPTSGIESQVRMIKYSDGRLETEIYTLPKGSQSIWEQLEMLIQQDPHYTIESLSSRLRIEKTEIKDSRKVERLVKQYSTLRLSPLLDSSVVLEGTGFNLWYETPSNSYHYSLVGSEPGDSQKNPPLIRWMNKVRRTLLPDYTFVK